MRKEWLWIGVAAVLLSACTAPTTEQQAPQQPYNGPVVEIGGVEPQYEPYNPNNMQDYKVNGDTYRIVKDPQNFSQTGLAAWYGEEANGNTTALGEQFDPNGLTAAHPTLPIPSYVRVTNLANGRQLVVRVNDRGPYTKGRIIDLSKAAADRLNLSNNTKVKVDFINVAPDGTLSGPGTIGTIVAKQSYALPARPDLGSSGMGTPINRTCRSPAARRCARSITAACAPTTTTRQPPAATQPAAAAVSSARQAPYRPACWKDQNLKPWPRRSRPAPRLPAWLLRLPPAVTWCRSVR